MVSGDSNGVCSFHSLFPHYDGLRGPFWGSLFSQGFLVQPSLVPIPTLLLINHMTFGTWFNIQASVFSSAKRGLWEAEQCPAPKMPVLIPRTCEYSPRQRGVKDADGTKVANHPTVK
jgi:hypothetical protein